MAAGQDYPDWTAPQAHADAIAATGTPPLTLVNGVAGQVVNVPANGIQLGNTFAFSQPSYELFMDIFQSGAGATGPLEVKMQWFENTFSQVIDQQSWWVWPGAATLNHQVAAKGPSRAGLLSMVFSNHSVAAAYRVTYWLYQRSHYYTRDDWRSMVFTSSVNAVTVPTNDTVEGLVCQTSALIAGGGNTKVQLPLYSGQVQVYADTTSNTTDMQLRFQNNTSLNASALNTRTLLIKSDANGRVNTQFQLPRYQWALEIDNGNAAAQTAQVWIHTVE